VSAWRQKKSRPARAFASLSVFAEDVVDYSTAINGLLHHFLRSLQLFLQGFFTFCSLGIEGVSPFDDQTFGNLFEIP
jgi:hypothetical protein